MNLGNKFITLTILRNFNKGGSSRIVRERKQTISLSSIRLLDPSKEGKT